MFTLLVAFVATLAALPVFADAVDVTDKLVNPCFDDGISGWNVEFTTTDNVTGYQWVTISDHAETIERGYFGLVAPVLFLETPQGTSPEKSKASQKVTGLANGTYVFSAIASFATRYLDLLANGAFIFANDSKVEGCNYNPYYNDRGSVPYAHTKRYQVATIVTDGTLEVGFCTIDGSGTYNVDADFCELWYFGDVKEEDALLEMSKIHMNQLKTASEEIMNGPITCEGAETLQSLIELAEASTTAEEYCWAEDTLRIANYASKGEIAKIEKLKSLIQKAKEVADGEWSEYVALYVAQLKEAIAVYESNIDAHMVFSSEVDQYMNDLQEMINQVRVDELYNLTEQLYTFTNDPNAISEDNPLFGITEHPGFGEDEGQYAYNQQEVLQALYDEVNDAIADFEDGRISATEVMSYVYKIDAAVAECIRSGATAFFTLPYDWIAMPSEDDPTVPNTTIKTVNNEYIRANFLAPTTYYGEEKPNDGGSEGYFRMQTPMMKFDKAYKQITLTVTATVGNNYNTTNDGPYYGIQEMYVLNGDGEEIQLTADNFSCNSMYPYPNSSLGGLVDHRLSYNTDNTAQFLTNGQSQANRGNHWIRIDFDEPVTEAKFVFEAYYNDWWLQNMIFSRMTISGYSEGESVLSEAIIAASGFSHLFGLEPGTYPVHDTELKSLIAEGQTMLDEGTATEAEMLTLADKIEKTAEAVKAVKMNKAVDGKEYYISQEYGGFVTVQGYKKHLTVFQDSILWFTDADPADKNQKWMLTNVEGDDPNDGNDWYYIQNVGTGKYLSTLIGSGQAWEPTGEPINWGENYMKLADKPAKVRIEYLNWGHVRLWCKSGDTGNYLAMHAYAHNNGYRSENPVANGGTSEVHPNGYSLNGVCGVVLPSSWIGGANTAVAWALHEVVNTLPATIELSERFGDETRHFATASNTFTFTADKPCAFDDFRVFCYREEGQELSCTVVRTINSVSVTFPDKWADFRFSFDNKEGVKQLTITSEAPTEEKSAMEELIPLYNTVTSIGYEEGTEIGYVKSIDALNAAMNFAGNLLENGGEEEQYKAAITAIEEALAGIETIQPEAGKKYVIVNGYEAKIRSGQPIEYGIYYNPKADAPGWTYLYPEDENYQWEFEPAEDGTWYIKNVATETYLSSPSKISEIYGMSTTPVPYKIISAGSNKVNIRCVVEGSDDNWNIHQNGFNKGFGTFGSLVVYNDHEKSRWFIREVKDSDVGIDIVEDENSLPVVKGIYDLTGRRISSPTSGLYIINGKKVLIK
ncbi:MAG: RICIN domain-containing protein [Bacteroidaceae bacterium]|nr:RICIN domain-containing protein [Bacteroidaceae bacterium]